MTGLVKQVDEHRGQRGDGQDSRHTRTFRLLHADRALLRIVTGIRFPDPEFPRASIRGAEDTRM
jgi:hypothetical protein